MIGGIYNKTTGLDPVMLKFQRIKKIGRAYGVRVGCKNTSGTSSELIPESKSRARKRVTRQRSAGLNVIILRYHAKGGRVSKRDDEGQVKVQRRGKRGQLLKRPRAIKTNLPSRDIQFFDDKEMAAGNDIWKKGFVEVLQGNAGDPNAELLRRCDELGELMVQAYRDHIMQRRGADGPLTPVLPGTERAKERATGKQGLPPLYRTGQLYNSFIHEVKRYK
jgi:hypothetical protein